jgi:energy-coupling factor transporter ATP-binding protein EcfA2
VNKQFYEALLPPEGSGHYCAVALFRGGGATQTYHNTIDELIARAQAIKEEQLDAYFALATFQPNKRSKENAAALKAFFLDLDCGEGKPYIDKIAAAQALAEFVETVDLPAPYIVNSGRGLHVYWPFEQAVSRDEWLPRARALKRLCVEHKLHGDPAVPADAARILRMPGTENHKSNPPLPVQIVATGVITPNDELFEKLKGDEPVSLLAAQQFNDDGMTRSLANVDGLPKSSFTRIVRKSLKGKEGCAQIAHAVNNSRTLEEPLWRAALSIAWRCTDGETAVHKLSINHPEYDAGRTVEKAQATVGPMTCEWYRTEYPEHCKGCPHSISSPIQLGRKVEEAPVVDGQYNITDSLTAENVPLEEQVVANVKIPAYPFPYFRGANGGVFRKDKDKEGEVTEVEIYKYDLYVTERFYDADEYGEGEGELVRVCIHTPRDGVRSIVAPVTTLLVLEKVRDLLLKHGVVVFKEQLGLIMAYLASSIRNLQRMAPADRTRNQMGWTADNFGFVVGDIEYTMDGVQLAPAGPASKAFVPALRVKGSLEKWTEMVNFYNRPGMEGHALGIFFGMGAPLLRLASTGEVRGAMINLMSNNSGTGKTTVLRVVNSLFGHPDQLMLQQADTVNSKMQVLGVMNTLPVTMDEITNMDDEGLSQLIYDIPQGRGKHRMESQTNKLRANAVTWTTFAITTSNSSIYDKLKRLKNQPDGELRRVIELRILRPLDIGKTESDSIFMALGEHYGLAGPVFIQYVLKNREAVIKKIKAVQAHVDKVFTLTQSDRFLSLQFACAFTAAGIYKALGLMDIETSRVFQYAIRVVREIQESVLTPPEKVTTINLSAVYQFITDNVSNTLVVNNENKGLGGTAAITVPKGPIAMRYEPDTKELWIPCSALRAYLTDRQVDYRATIADLQASGVLKYEKGSNKRLASGAISGFNAAAVRCYCLDTTKLSDDFIETFSAPDGEPESGDSTAGTGSGDGDTDRPVGDTQAAS